MAYDLSGDTGGAGDFDLIPNGTLAFGYLNVKPAKVSAAGNSSFEFELTIDGPHPYVNRKVWGYIGDPTHPGTSEKYANMGKAAMQRILETGRGAHRDRAESYQVEDIPLALSGCRVAVKIKIEKGKDGYQDQNRVQAWLSAQPDHPGHSDYQKLANNDFGNPQVNAMFGGGQKLSGFGAPAVGTPAPAPTQTQLAPQAGGFGQPQPPAQPQGDVAGGGGPAWLEQANAGQPPQDAPGELDDEIPF